MRHTPGNWQYEVNKKHNCSFDIHNGEQMICFEVSDHGDTYSYDEAEANAKLIAAAPKMLKALDEIESIQPDDDGDRIVTPEMMKLVRSAIEKATK